MFEYIILLSALLLASCAAFFSVTGISQLFIGSLISAGIMAAALEFGKIVTVSYLYRYWNKSPRSLKAYLSIGLFVLMCITSTGIYGYLTSAYAAGSAGVRNQQNQIELYQEQDSLITQNLNQSTNRLQQLEKIQLQQENRVDSLIQKNKSIYTQQRIISNNSTQIDNLRKEISTLSNQKDSLELLTSKTTQSLNSNGKIGAFYYVSKMINVPLDTLVRWFTLIIVLVFDPMSISLFVAYNVVIKNKSIILKTNINHDDMIDKSPDEIITQNKIDIIPNNTTSSNVPYYMSPNYDWKNDQRWREDPAAKSYFLRLGINPLDN